ncbi:hypothetical protein [Actinoplanes auranticolor]|uniref:hypothetical protein n=1 Tax=Actinoplanes auranticolor TaxID=47988 RepID=UPI001BB351A3|nr:hypothetical protein [Actinoplanes auranticolor]
MHAQVGDGVDGLGGEAFRFVESVSAAADLDGLGGVREVDARRDGQDFEGADLAVAVAAVGVAGGVRDGLPGQGGESVVQVRLVAFDGQVGAAFGEVGDEFPRERPRAALPRPRP